MTDTKKQPVPPKVQEQIAKGIPGRKAVSYADPDTSVKYPK